MNRKITDFLKEPLSDGRLKLFPSLLVFCCSIFVNAYFQVTSFSALAQWFLKISGTENVSEQLAEILARTDTPIGMRIAFGLLMTVFVMVFMLIAVYWVEGRKHFGHIFERACSTMLVPMLLLLIAALLMNVSFTLGVLFGVAAAIGCVAVIVNSGKKANCNANLSNLAKLHRRKPIRSATISLPVFSKGNTLSLSAPTPTKPIFTIISIGTPSRWIVSGSFEIFTNRTELWLGSAT